MKLNNLRKQANEQGFTLIELMIVIAIIGILAAVAIPNFIEYKNKSYCTATVNDVGAIGGALADYFAIPGNVSATTSFVPGAPGERPYIVVGNNGTPPSNTLLLSASTTAASAAQKGPNYLIYATEGAENCPQKVRAGDKHWTQGADNGGNGFGYFKTL